MPYRLDHLNPPCAKGIHRTPFNIRVTLILWAHDRNLAYRTMVSDQALLTGKHDGMDVDVPEEVVERIFRSQRYQVEVMVTEGWSTTSPTRAFGSCSVTRRLLSTNKDLEGIPRSGLRGQEGPGRAPVRDRRRRGDTRGRRSDGRFCLDEFGPLNLMPHPGRHWAAISGKDKDPDREPRPRRRATYNRNDGVRHLFAAYDLTRDRLFGHVKTPSTRVDQRVGDWVAANNVELAYTPTNSSWLNRIKAQCTALRYVALDGTEHRSHKEQGSVIRRYIIWRNRHADDTRLRQVVARANVA
jgi:hypothetical protein